jgi:hypothetical protein
MVSVNVTGIAGTFRKLYGSMNEAIIFRNFLMNYFQLLKAEDLSRNCVSEKLCHKKVWK